MSIRNSFALFRKKLCEKDFFVTLVLLGPHEVIFLHHHFDQLYFHLKLGENRAPFENQYNGNYSLYDFQTVCAYKGDQYACK